MAIYRAAAPPEFFQDLRKVSGKRAEGGVYSAQLTAWQMMRQRLDGKGTLSTAVQEVAEGRPQALLRSHKRLKKGTLSPNNGAYCRARKRLGKEVAGEVADRIFNYLIADVAEALPGLGRRAFLLDGSSLDLPATPELLRAYPPAENQYGPAHWPVVRIVVAHDLISGLAMQPIWGPMYGDQAVSEQQLAATGIGQLPAGSVVVGDRNFGVFSTAYDAQQRGYAVIVRLTDARARFLLKGKLPQETDQWVDWTPSRWDRQQHPDLPPDACVRGRVIARRVINRGQIIQLYFFTVLELPPEQIVTLYGYRWNIETDLRSLKQTVHLHSLKGKSLDMVAKELVLGVAAYNLVRGTIFAAARVAGIEPRELSFSRVQDVINACLPSLAAATSPEAYQRVLDRMLRRAAQCKLPHRPHRPSYPRAVWPRRSNFPKRKKT
ncbi:MAG: IS4 family transposase [Acidobacteriia bacterium]|nr:IS4 family transposase [Terriglobia bacterium]